MQPNDLNNIIRWNKADKTWITPGLVDVQINGINGIDFNNISLNKEDMLFATKYLLSRGVTTFFPTIITNSTENILTLLNTISEACTSFPLVRQCVGGIHLEGPFISPLEGARGAHNPEFIKDPDWDIFLQFQKAAEGKIKIITISPESKGAVNFIRSCQRSGIIVSMGHSLANSRQIKGAVKAGLILSTHLGNGIPLMLKRHPNPLWDQLAEENLYTTIITDGHHLPDSFIKTVMQVKKEKLLLVSDATCFSGLPPGEYNTVIGGTVILTKDKRVELKNSPGLLAGAAKDLLEDVETLVAHNLAKINEAWVMASEIVWRMLSFNQTTLSHKTDDRVIFSLDNNQIHILETRKGGITVFKK